MKDILFVLINMVANTVQAITGFAGGPLAMSPAIAVVGLQNAKAAVTLILLVSCSVVTFQNIKKINVKIYLFMMAFMVVGVTVGILIFSMLPAKVLMLIYGLIVVAIGIKKLLRPVPKELRRPWNYGAMLLAGLMQGMFTSGGPFLVLYAAAALPDKNEFRATVSAIWSSLNVYLVLSMFVQGWYTPYCLGLFAKAIIPVFIVIAIGNRIADRIPKDKFLKLVYFLLMLSGAILVLNALS